MRPEPPAWGGAPPAPFARSGKWMPGERLCSGSGCPARFCARAVFWARAVLMLGIRPDCLRSEPRL